ncbi:porin family protein [Pleomorphovibrio marinus]|uniref:porin family protein n=1 Tax=Pleomorphovibrio marinus TaxID=2164132 RepID=UPI000E0A7848|nr:porin family protein [Pleomorphovibrio marinus]
MKRYVFFLMLSMALIGQSQAQLLSFGPKFGVSQGDVRVFEGFQGDDSKMGYHVGAFARINLPVLFIQPELLYTNTGGSFQDNSFNYDVSFDRLDVPIMVGINFAGIFRLQAGPIASYMIDSKMTSSGGGTQNTFFPPKEEFTFGYQAGVGLDIGNFLLDLKYEGGLTNSVNGFDDVPTDQRQNQLILSLGFRLF